MAAILEPLAAAFLWIFLCPAFSAFGLGCSGTRLSCEIAGAAARALSVGEARLAAPGELVARSRRRICRLADGASSIAARA